MLEVPNYILEEIKIRLEIYDTDIYDKMLSSYIRSGMNVLKQFNVPVMFVGDENLPIYLDYLDGYCSLKMEKQTDPNIKLFLEASIHENLTLLSSIYDK